MLNVIHKADTLATMAHSQAHKADTRERILHEAAEQLRLRGLDGISISELMKGAGLTHGGFYRHFASREDLVAQAVGHALEDSRARVGQKSMASYVRGYLSQSHRDAPGQGCAIAALAGEVAHADSETRAVFTEGIRTSLTRIAARQTQSAAASGTDPAQQLRDGGLDEAMLALSTLVGTLVLSRAVDDPVLSDRLLAVGREKLQQGLLHGNAGAGEGNIIVFPTR